MKKAFQYPFKEILLTTAGAASLGIVGAMVLRVARSVGFWDFDVFYSSARAALQGINYYSTYGTEHLPYWYFPWLAWFFIPFAVFPYSTAKILYLALTLGAAAWVVHVLGKRFNPRLSPGFELLILSMSLLMSMLLFIAGQMDFILIAIIAAVILLLDRDKSISAGLLFPILLFKPHVLAVFLPFLLLRGDRAFRRAALGSTVALGVLGFFLVPNWPGEMIRMLTDYGGRSDNYWNFITLPQLLGSQENWSGTANLPVTVGLLIVGLFACWKLRRLPLLPFLSLTLAASMFCAPRAYTYNLPILIPPLLWITVGHRLWGPLLWLGVGATALASNWSTGSYIIVVAAFGFAILEGRRMLSEIGAVAAA